MVLPVSLKLKADDKAMDRYRRTAGAIGIEHVDWESDWKDAGCIKLSFRDEEFCEKFRTVHYLDVIR
ncbi:MULTISPECIES: hypothetical protein [unclassified Mesorhizobium]|uniref:hypothetical protein n=1 Tax=unclassified Mesorhizobium TaxID=325217 RepID=UPI00333D6746